MAARHFPLSVIDGPASRAPQARGHRGPLQFPRHPSDHSTPPTPEGAWAPAPGSQVPSMAFASRMEARLPLGPLARGFLTTPQASLDAADWPVAPRPASTPGSHPTPGAALPGTLASPRTGLAPAGCRELVARLRRAALLSVVLGARATGRTLHRNRDKGSGPLPYRQRGHSVKCSRGLQGGGQLTLLAGTRPHM